MIVFPSLVPFRVSNVSPATVYLFCNLCSERKGGEVERTRGTGRRGGGRGRERKRPPCYRRLCSSRPQRLHEGPGNRAPCLPLLGEAGEDPAFAGTPERAGAVASAQGQVRETGPSETAFRTRTPGPLRRRPPNLRGRGLAPEQQPPRLHRLLPRTRDAASPSRAELLGSPAPGTHAAP